jgi:hypothetical protein
MGVCNVLPTICEGAFENLFSGLKGNRWVGDFQVATGGGFWVATRDQAILNALAAVLQSCREAMSLDN